MQIISELRKGRLLNNFLFFLFVILLSKYDKLLSLKLPMRNLEKEAKQCMYKD